MFQVQIQLKRIFFLQHTNYLMQSTPKSQNQTQFSFLVVKQVLQRKLQNEFNQVSTPKCFYIHKQILNILNFIFDFKLQIVLKGCNIYEFIDCSKAIDADSALNDFFFIYAKPQSMKTISSLIVHNQTRNIKKQYYVYFVPVIDYQCQEELKKSGVYEKIKLKKFDFNFLPYTQKLFSLQLASHLTTREQQSCIVQALLKLEFMRGGFKNIFGKGKIAKSVLECLETKRKQISQINEKQQDCDLLIVLERNFDYITPMLTGFSYECLLDFFFGIDNNRINVPAYLLQEKTQSQKQDKQKSQVQKQQSKFKTQAYLLGNKKDAVYEQISSKNIKQVPNFLIQKSKKLRKKIQIKKNQATTYEELNQLNNTLMLDLLFIQNHQSIVNYILQKMKSVYFNNSMVMENNILQEDESFKSSFFEDLEYLSLNYTIEHLIRMICLQSQTSEQARYYSKNEKSILDFLQNIDRIDQIPTLSNLLKKQILRQSKFNNWKQKTVKFQLFPEQNKGQPDPITELNINYFAFLVKCVQLILKNNLDPQRSTLIHKQTYFRGQIPKQKKIGTVYLLMIGGISYNQISCLKELQKIQGKTIKILTTQILGNNQLIKNFLFNPIQP